MAEFHASIVHGDVGFNQICNASLSDLRVPEKRLTRVEFTLKDGRILRSQVYAADGEAGDHVDMDWMVRKFRRITAPFLSSQGQQLVLELLTTDPERKLRHIVSGVNCIPKEHAAER